MRTKVLYHDNCFDGAASAAYLSRYLRDSAGVTPQFSYQGLAHKASQLFEDSWFDGEVNAIVDFKYSSDPRVTWWFDHHQSAFLSPEDQQHFLQNPDERKMFDPSYKSCTKFIADMLDQKFGYRPEDLTDLVYWADIIDGAQYPSAEEAVMLTSAASKLVLVIENAKEPATMHGIIRAMQDRTLLEIIESPEIQALYQPLYKRHLKSIDVIRAAARHERGTVFFDLVDQKIDSYNKFIPYYLFDDSVYTVSVTVSTFRSKVSVGSNPWLKTVPHNLATICERYGGGGHARVGAISFPVPAVEEARQAASEIVAELQSAF
jgi:hypothetical protein